MIRPIDIRLNAAHPELKLPESVTYTGAPSTVLIRGVPPNYGRWAITAVSVAATFPDGSTTTRAAVQSANGVWVATLPGTARSGRTTDGFRVIADGIDENGEAVSGYILAVADFAVASLGVAPAPAPGETSWQMLYFDATPATPRKGDVIRADGDLKFYNGTAWLPFTDLSNYYTAEQVDEAIDKLAAYYITYTAAGAAFPTYAALANAQTVYSGGVVRTPTRNDYAVVLADESHDGAEYRYIYAVAEGQTVGQWEPQYPIETNDYAALSNKPQINGNTLTGNKTGANLGLVDATNGVATGLGMYITSYQNIDYIVKFARHSFSAWSWTPCIILKAVNGSVDTHKWILPSSDGTIALIEDICNYIAPKFSESKSYSVYQLVSYEGDIYQCTSEHSAGAWNDDDFELVDMSDVIPIPSTSTPLMDGTGSAGTPGTYACSDHRHPSDSTKLDKSGPNNRKIQWNEGSGRLDVVDESGGHLQFPKNTYSSGETIASREYVNDKTPYALVTKTIDNGAVTLADRAINAVAVSSSLASLTVNFPTATSGKARDFGLRLTVASGITTAPELALPQGVTCENADGEAPEIGADGAATILYFTETASGVFLVKGEVLQTITQA